MGFIDGLEAIVGLFVFVILVVAVGGSFLANETLPFNSLLVFFGISIIAIIFIAVVAYSLLFGGGDDRVDVDVRIRNARAR